MAERTTYGDISPRTAAYAAVGLLDVGQFLTVTERYGQAKPIPKKHTQTIKFRRYESLNRATSPLAEGITPAGQKLRKTDVTAILQQYGDLVEITDVIQDTHEDPVLKEAVKRAGEQISETIEVVRISVLKAGSTVYYANSAATRATTNSPPTRGDLRKIVRFFNKGKAKPISSIVKASPMISTEPVAPAFFAMCHTDLKPDLRGISGFTPIENYSDADKRLPGEVGKCEEIRFICTPLFEPWLAAATSATGTEYLSNGVEVSSAAAPDVYPILIVAQDAYGIVPLQGENAVTPGVLNPNKITKDDPLGQRGFVSWKMWQTAVILNDNWMVRLEATCTASPS